MGFSGISLWQLLIILVIVILLFGTRKLRSLGGDLGEAVKSFRKGVREGEDAAQATLQADSAAVAPPALGDKPADKPAAGGGESRG